MRVSSYCRMTPRLAGNFAVRQGRHHVEIEPSFTRRSTFRKEGEDLVVDLVGLDAAKDLVDAIELDLAVAQVLGREVDGVALEQAGWSLRR